MGARCADVRGWPHAGPGHGGAHMAILAEAPPRAPHRDHRAAHATRRGCGISDIGACRGCGIPNIGVCRGCGRCSRTNRRSGGGLAGADRRWRCGAPSVTSARHFEAPLAVRPSSTSPLLASTTCARLHSTTLINRRPSAYGRTPTAGTCATRNCTTALLIARRPAKGAPCWTGVLPCGEMDVQEGAAVLMAGLTFPPQFDSSHARLAARRRWACLRSKPSARSLVRVVAVGVEPYAGASQSTPPARPPLRISRPHKNKESMLTRSSLVPSPPPRRTQEHLKEPTLASFLPGIHHSLPRPPALPPIHAVTPFLLSLLASTRSRDAAAIIPAAGPSGLCSDLATPTS